jgi:hypothetical protein
VFHRLRNQLPDVEGGHVQGTSTAQLSRGHMHGLSHQLKTRVHNMAYHGEQKGNPFILGRHPVMLSIVWSFCSLQSTAKSVLNTMHYLLYGPSGDYLGYMSPNTPLRYYILSFSASASCSYPRKFPALLRYAHFSHLHIEFEYRLCYVLCKAPMWRSSVITTHATHLCL